MLHSLLVINVYVVSSTTSLKKKSIWTLWQDKEVTHLLSYMRECSVVDIYCNPYCWKTERNKFRLFRDKAGTDILELQTTLVFHLVELWTVTEKERICLAWIITRLSGLFFFFFFFLSQNIPQNSTKIQTDFNIYPCTQPSSCL